MLQVVGLQRDARRLVKDYSHGMRQRLGIALALLSEPEVLILDEPTNGLDPAGIHEMRDLIRGLPAENGITVFLSSHLLAEVEQLASHVGIIGRGRLLFQGPLGDLQSRQRERVVIEVDSPAVASSILISEGWAVELSDGSSMSVDVAGRADTARVAATLVGANVSLYQLRSVQPSLETLFLDLTNEATLVAPSTSAESQPIQ